MPFNEEMIQTIRNQSKTMEHSGQLTPDVLDAIYEKKLFKLFVPLELGGNMTALPEALRIFERAAWIDGSFGWLVNIGSGGAYFLSVISPSTSKALFTNKKAVIAGSGYPSGKAKRVEGGYIVSGEWKYCSGAPHATIFTATCTIESEAEREDPEVRSFILMPEEVHIISDWHAFGLKATASHSIRARDVFVPEERSFALTDNDAYYHEPIYTYPFVQFAQTSFAAVAIGIGKHFLQEATSIAKHNQQAWSSSQPDRFAFVMRKIRHAEKLFEKTVAHFYETVETSWEKHVNDRPLSQDEQEQISRSCKETTRVALHCAQSIFPYLGMHAIMEDTVINRTWRDLHTACQNVLVVPFYEVDTGQDF